MRAALGREAKFVVIRAVVEIDIQSEIRITKRYKVGMDALIDLGRHRSAKEQPPPCEDEADRLEALGVLTPLEKGLLQAKRAEAAERAAASQRFSAEWDAERRLLKLRQVQ